MFTLEQLKTAHSRVQSGADFPAYIQTIKGLGVTSYETFVTNGHAVYYGTGTHALSTGALYGILSVAGLPDAEQFKADLKAHQQGKTDYLTFCNDCARSGVEKWVIVIAAMTCTYFDKTGQEVLVELIPHT